MTIWERVHTMRTGVAVILTATVLAIGLLAMPATAQAAGVVGDGTPASCTDSALQNAFASGSGTISFNCGAAPVTMTITTKVVGAGQSYVISGNSKVTLDGQNNVQMFIVSNGGELTLRNITLRQGSQFDGGTARVAPSGSLTLFNVQVLDSGLDVDLGGAIYNEGLLEIERSFFQDNVADEAGGAIYNSGTASIRTSHILGNEASDPVLAVGDGGAIFNSGTMTIDSSTIFANDAKRHGGGIHNQGGTLTIVNSTLAENTAGAAGKGGALHAASGGLVTITSSTIVRNNADTAGAIWVASIVSMRGTIVANSSVSADNGTPSLNCDGPTLTSLGTNLISDGTCVDGSVTGDIRNTEPKLKFIDDNGGLTPTLLPLPDSPVIDVGPTSGCPERDQRGIERPVGGRCDIGAVEVSIADAPNATFLPVVTSN